MRTQRAGRVFIRWGAWALLFLLISACSFRSGNDIFNPVLEGNGSGYEPSATSPDEGTGTGAQVPPFIGSSNSITITCQSAPGSATPVAVSLAGMGSSASATVTVGQGVSASSMTIPITDSETSVGLTAQGTGFELSIPGYSATTSGVLTGTLSLASPSGTAISTVECQNLLPNP